MVSVLTVKGKTAGMASRSDSRVELGYREENRDRTGVERE